MTKKQPQPFFITLAQELQKIFEKARCEAYFDGQRDCLKALDKTLTFFKKSGGEVTPDEILQNFIPDCLKNTEENRQEALKEYEKQVN